MRLLLTSGGVTNPSIHSALVQLLGKPVAESHALCVPDWSGLRRVTVRTRTPPCPTPKGGPTASASRPSGDSRPAYATSCRWT